MLQLFEKLHSFVRARRNGGEVVFKQFDFGIGHLGGADKHDFPGQVGVVWNVENGLDRVSAIVDHVEFLSLGRFFSEDKREAGGALSRAEVH